MRPQIRSLPLSKVKCPQFCWAERNNSQNVSVALQPDLYQNKRKNDTPRDTLVEHQEKIEVTPNECRYCMDHRLRPTLFPHPVSCFCSNEPLPTENEKYRHCKLNMDQAIGDVLEEIAMKTISTFPPTTAPRTDRLMKKIIKSAYIPQQVDLLEQTSLVDCLAKDSMLLKELLDRIRYKRVEDEGEHRKSCLVEEECRKKAITTNGDCKAYRSFPELIEDRSRTLKKVLLCPCKELRHPICVDCSKCRCQCRTDCMKCICNPEEFKSINSLQEDIYTEPSTDERHEGLVVEIEKNTKRHSKDKDSETEESSSGQHRRKTKKIAGKTKKPKNKLPNKLQPKSSATITKFKRPDNIICERFELVETEPFCNVQETGASQEKETCVMQIYERRAVGEVKPGSFRSTTEHKETNTPKRTRVKFQKPAKIPWNWHNQPKKEDSYTECGGKSYSWSYARLGRDLEDKSNNLLRRRGGDSLLVRSEPKEPKYYEYRPNLRPKNKTQVVAADTEEEIKRKEERRYKKGYGRMRVKNWHQKLEQNSGHEKQKSDEPSGKTKEKSEFSEDNSEEEEDFEEFSGAEDQNRKEYLQRLVGNAQKGPIGTHGPAEIANLKTFTNRMADSTLASTSDNANITNEVSGEIEGFSRRRLPVIKEEKSGKSDTKTEGKVKMDRLCSVEKGDEEFFPGTMRGRPSTAEGYLEDVQDTPVFNLIKQRIYSRKKTLENLDSFRKEISTKTTDVDHTCVHRFTIDERLFPKPLHSDESGASCCVHCDKPMAACEKTVFLDQRESKGRLQDEVDVKKQGSKLSLRTKSVHIGSKDSLMEIRLRPEHEELLKGYGGETGRKREFYTNSLALRHQRR